MRKRITAIIMTCLMMLEMVPGGLFQPMEAQASSVTPALKYGDYFILGRYLGEEIVWRHVGSDGYGDVALSFKVLTSKAYNSIGVKPANTSVPDGIKVPQEADPHGARATQGSNLWVNSTLRAWLNSDAPAGQVTYIGNAPSGGNVTANPYDQEAGFLSNFTAPERAAMAPKEHGAALNEVDIALRTAGTQVAGWDNGISLTDPIRHMVTDTVFIPDAHMLSRIANDSGLSWSIGYWSTGFHRAGITDMALKQAKAPQTPGSEYAAVEYWTNTPVGSQWDGTHRMQIRLIGGGHSFQPVNNGVMGVRPAFYLKQEAITIAGGSGTQDDPYIIATSGSSFDITLRGNNTAKLYTPDEDLLQISAPVLSGLTMSYIKVDPEANISIASADEFAALGSAESLSHTGGKATLAVDQNCTVWVMAKGMVSGQERVSFAHITYKNFYDRVQILQEGKIKGTETYLYHNTVIEGIYGVPLNRFQSPDTVIAGVSYDQVSASDALPAYLRPYWTRTDSSPDSVKLDQASYCGDPVTITMQYQKTSGKWWTVRLEFVDEQGKSIMLTAGGVSTDSVTLAEFIPSSAGGVRFSDFDLSYTLPVGENLYPYAWQVGDGGLVIPGSDGGMSSGFDPCITADGQTVKVYYKSNRVTVTERFVADDGTGKSLHDDVVVWVDHSSSYKKLTAPRIDHYVVTGYQVGDDSRVDLPYAGGEWNANLQWQSIDRAVTKNTTVMFFFAADVDGDGVPDKDQYRITARWIGVRPNGTETDIKAPQYVRTRVGIDNNWANNGNGANDGSLGDEAHVITGADPEKWIFDKTRSGAPAVQSVNQPSPQDVYFHFYYDYDSKGTGVPDKNQGVREKYAISDGNSLTYPPEWAETFTGVLEGGSYSRAVPTKSGYVAEGWFLEGEGNGSSLRPFTGAGGSRAELSPTPAPRNTVTFVYRTAAAPVTICWVGTTLTGHKITFGAITVQGYVGEVRVLDKNTLRGSVEVDGNVWEWDEGQSTVPDSITFSSDPQDYVFYYAETKTEIIYDIHCWSDDGKVNIEYKIIAGINDAPFTVKPREIPLYTYEKHEIWEYDRLYGQGTSGVVTLDPSQGAMSVYFYYTHTPSVADVTLKAVKQGSGEVILSKIYPGKLVGKDFSVSAPYIEGWALADTEPVIKTVTVSSGGNEVTFAYDRPESVFINCIEQRGSEKIVLRTVPVTAAGEVSPPDLSTDYFDFDAANAANSDHPYTVTNDDFRDGKIISYYYKSQMMDVQIVAKDGDGNTLYDKTLTSEARKGEMYTVSAPAIAGYALSEPSVKEVYADPNLQVILVTFAYHTLAPGEVTVRHYYQDGGTKVVLKEYTAQAEVGRSFTAYAEAFSGFELTDSGRYTATISKVDSDPSKNIIEFQYNDVRKTVTVQIRKSGVIDDSLTQTVKVPAGAGYTVYPPYISDFSLAGYQIGGGTEVTSGLAAINIGAVNGDVTVTLNYVSVKYVNITVIGEAEVSGEELFRFVDQVRYSGNNQTVINPATDLPKLELWMLKAGQESTGIFAPNAHRTITFYYETRQATITIKAQESGGGDVLGFVPITVGAIKGEPFRFDAPYIDGYKLSDGEQAVQTIDNVTVDATLTFVYDAIQAGNVTVRMMDENENPIGTETHTLADGESREIPVPDLRDRYFTAISDPQTVTYTGTPLDVTYYYERDTIEVVKKTYLASDMGNPDAKPLLEIPMGEYRIGEMIRFHAPSKEAFEVFDSAVKLVRIFPPAANPNARVRIYQTVVFYYAPIASDTLVVEALNEDGGILLTYSVPLTGGTSILVSAPIIPGYTLRPGEPLSKTGTAPGKVQFHYVEPGRLERLTASVTFGDTGKPAYGAEVSVKEGAAVLKTGTANLVGKIDWDILYGGNYTVTAKYAGYRDAAQSFKLDGNKTITLVLDKIGPGGNSNSGGSGGGGGGGSDEGKAIGYVNGNEIVLTVNADGSVSRVLSEAEAEEHHDETDTYDVLIPNQTDIRLTLPVEKLRDAWLVIHTDFGRLTFSNEGLQRFRVGHGNWITIHMVHGSIIISMIDEYGEELDYADQMKPLLVEMPLVLDDTGGWQSYVMTTGEKQRILPFSIWDDGMVKARAPETGRFDYIYNPKTFVDAENHWGYENIRFVAARELFSGTGVGRFDADGTMTRAMFAMVMANLQDADLSIYESSRFHDVPAGKWYTAAIEWAADTGIVQGVGNGNFAPDAEVTREQMAQMLYQYLLYKGGSLGGMSAAEPFPDSHKISTWAVEAVEYMRLASVIRGRADGTFDPKAPATRAEVASIFARFVEAYIYRLRD